MISHGKDLKIFSGNSNSALAEAICKELRLPLGDLECEIGRASCRERV